MPLPLAEAAKRIESGPCHFGVQRHLNNSGVLQQVFEENHRFRSQACKRTILVSNTATEDINKLSAPSIAARNRELSCSFAMVAIIADVSRTIRTATRSRHNPRSHPPAGNPERACVILARRTHLTQPCGRRALVAQHGTTVLQPRAPARFRRLRPSGGRAAAQADRPWLNEYSWDHRLCFKSATDIASFGADITPALRLQNAVLASANWIARSGDNSLACSGHLSEP